jgi:putative membrane protein
MLSAVEESATFALMNKSSDNTNLSLRDVLALDRTRMANYRTLLAFIITSLHIGALGLTFHKLEEFERLSWLFIPLIVLSLLVFTLGLGSYIRVKKDIDQAYKRHLD